MSHFDLSPYWQFVKSLFAEHHFITIVCGLVLIAMTVSFYRFLKSVSPALPPVVMLLVMVVLLLHWTQTRTEPKILSPAVNLLTHIIPTGDYAPPKPVPPRPKRVS